MLYDILAISIVLKLLFKCQSCWIRVDYFNGVAFDQREKSQIEL